MEISIPTTQLATDPKPHTAYIISLRLPLRSFTIPKRFSDFLALHSALTSQAGAPPPLSPPPKTYFQSSTHNPALAESRRQALQTYLQTISGHADPRWRETPAWRAFLNLPSSASQRSSIATSLHGTLTASSAPITDPVVWLDCHRDVKGLLQEARIQITRRDQAGGGNVQAQHEAAAAAKKSLVKAGAMIQALAEGLKRSGEEWGAERLGEGEVRRRRDLVASARKEKEGLEALLNAMAAKASVDASLADKDALVGLSAPGSRSNGGARGGKAHVSSGRVLGKETARTRELDNSGVLALQKQMMVEQDEDVSVLAAAVRRQRELGEEINRQLVEQNEMLGMLDEDVTRVKGKVDVARKRVDKIR